MKRLLWLVLLLGLSVVLFLVALLFQHGHDGVSAPLWLPVGALVAALVAALLLQRRPGLWRALWARPYLVVATIALLGLLLRLSLIAANRFYPDEALYAHWGLLIASGQDVFLKAEIVDKPPLFFYTLALFFKLFGPSETAARLPNIMASVAGIILVYGLAREMFGRRVATLAALFLALSPFDILFAPTAFTDSLMVALAIGGCLAALRGRYLAAGLLIGLAAMTKPTAVFFLPLLAFLGAVALVRAGWKPQYRRAGLRLGAGLGAVTLAGALWDVVMRVGSPKVLDAGSAHYGGMRLVPLAGLLPHLGEWLAQLRFLLASPPLDVLLLVGVPLLVGYGLWRRERRPGWLFDLALTAFVLFFIGVHTVLSFAAWDRYLLGLAPIVALLLARVVLLPFDVVPWQAAACGALMAAFLAASLLAPLPTALQGGFPVGSDHGQYEGIDQVAAYFRGNVAPGAAVFHHDEGWHYSYYMFDCPYSFCYYPDAGDLLGQVRRLPPGQEKYVALPDWVDPGPMQGTLRAGGWTLRPVYRTYRRDGSLSFTVYRIQPQEG